MKLQNFRINKGVPAILLLSLVLVACGGGSVDSNSGSAAAQTGIAPATTVPTVAAPSTISAPSTIAGCSTTGATGAIALSNVPSRTTGVAPLSVFFDATGTTATATKQPFHDLEYRWDFGNPAGSPVNGTTWKTGSKPGVNSRNTATGPETSHVYETPGTYTVALTATDGTNKVSSCTQIVVQDPNTVFSGTNTICVGATSTPVQGQDGCPAGAAVATQSNFATAVNAYIATGKRILFKHDDTFTTTTSSGVNVTGPGTIGMYGVGAKPKILAAGNVTNGIIRLGSPATYTMQDWRIMDLEFDGQSNSSVSGFKINGVADQITVLRVNAHHMLEGFFLEASTLEYYMATNGYTEHMFDQISVVDSSFTNISGYGLFMWANHLSILGNMVDDAGTGIHTVRIMHATGGVVSNNTFANPSPIHQAFTLRAPSYTDCRPKSGCEYYPNLLPGAAAYTTKVVVSDNHFIAGNTAQPVTVEPSNSSIDDGRFKDIILERNWYTGGSTQCCNPMLKINAQYVTVRNELIDLSGAGTTTRRGVSIEAAGSASLGSDNVKFYNNTIFSNDSASFVAIAVHATTTNTTVVNNLAYAPNASGLFYDNGAGATTPTTGSNNTTTTNASPLMATIPPTTAVGFSIATGSYAIGTGIVVPVWSDFFSTPQTATRDMGAIQGPKK